MKYFTKILKRSAIATVLMLNLGISQDNTGEGVPSQEIQRNGLSGWQFLKINVDAKSAAMGNASASLGLGDASSVFANPSAITGVENMDIYAGNVAYVAEIGYNAFSLVKNLGALGVVAVSVASLDMGDIPETINAPVGDRTEYSITGKNYTGGNTAAGLTLARSVSDKLSVGMNVRYIQETIDDLSMSNVSFDFGTTFYTGYKSLRLGMTFKNIGGDVQLAGWDEAFQTEPVDVRMPVDFKVGMAMEFLPGENLTVAVDASHPNDSPEKIHIGTQYNFNDMLFLRGGYKIGYDEDTLTFGVGISYSMINASFSQVTMGRLGNVSMMSLGVSL
tara:strand:- start:91 stop:1089 length:999 start_codon:yes stop_codon:yes gene_type:complete